MTHSRLPRWLPPTALALAWLCGACNEAAAGSSAGPDASLSPDAGLLVATTQRPERVDEVHCALPGTRADAVPRAALQALQGAGFDAPVAMLPRGEALLVAERDGRLLEVGLDGDTYDARQVGDLGAQGALLSVVLHPDYVSNGYLFARHLPGGAGSRSQLSRYDTDLQSGMVDVGSALPVLELSLRDGERHGGALLFDAAGMLLIGVGDGGELGTGYRDAADRSRLSGKLLRIDVDTLDSLGRYSIPTDNPLVDGADGERPEVYALGLRDPVGCALDPVNGAVYCADRGAQYSELNRITAGVNYGWPSQDANTCTATGELCLGEPISRPLLVQAHRDGGCGVVGPALPTAPEPAALQGIVVQADACDSLVSGYQPSPDGTRPTRGSMARATDGTALMGVGPTGELLRIDNKGTMWRMGVAPDGVPGSFPEQLSDTGCYADLATATPAADLIEFRVNSPLWTDGAHKRRWLAIPPGTRIDAPAEGPWTFPVGSILVKEFALQLGPERDAVQPVETRFMIKRPEGWEFHGYRWNEAGDDATLVGKDETVSYQVYSGATRSALDYQFPGPATCPTCHSRAPGRPLGPRTDQLNAMLRYDDGLDDQLAVFAELGLLELPTASAPQALPQLPDPADASAPLQDRARSYLHANCAHCHQPGGWSSPDLTLDLRYEIPLEDSHSCGVGSQFYQSGQLRIAPGDPGASSLLQRMLETGVERMPPVATTVVDPQAVDLLTRWIAELSCP